MANKKAVDLMVGHMNKSVKARGQRSRGLSPLHAPDARVAKFSLSYLDAFGYLQEELDKWKDITIGDIVEAVKSFQRFFGMKRTGELTVQTVRAMEMPRCGCPDINRSRFASYKAVRDFAAASLPKWRKSGLVYTIKDYVPGLSKPDFEQVIYNGFRAWTQHGNVEARPAQGSERPDIIISTGQGPQSNFDGPGGTLAWAYLPDGSDQQLMMKFDLGETFILTPGDRGILIPNVFTHEAGHLWGLDHSRVQPALMAPYYNAGTSVPQPNDDIPRFQARYGVRPAGGPTPPPGPTTPPGGTNRELTIRATGMTVLLDGRQIA